MLKLVPISSLLALLFASTCLVVTQAQTQAPNNGGLGAMQLEQVQIDAQSIGSFFSELALSSNIPIGLEISSKETNLVSYGIVFKKGTLSELLNQFVIQHNQYAWEIRDGVVNVAPKDGYRDALFHALLETRIGRFTVKEHTSCWTLADTLVSTPELKRVLEANSTKYRAPDFSGFYIPQSGRHFKLEVSNVTLKFILNGVVEQSPTAKFWVIARNYDQSLSISFGARHEDSPSGDGNRVNLRESRNPL